MQHGWHSEGGVNVPKQARVRSESLYLTELARRYTFQITDETDLRSRISAQQTRRHTLIEQAIDTTDPGDGGTRPPAFPGPC